jgi:predicted nucleic acid-binding protein
VAVALATGNRQLATGIRLVAPTLIRSQVLSLLHQRVGDGSMNRTDAMAALASIRQLPIRLLGDRVLQDLAWKIADQLGWSDTFDAEYIALTKLQADALVTDDTGLGEAVSGLVRLATIDQLVH